MARHDLSDLSDADLARLLGSKGRHGDTLVAHISPLEAAILRLLGGSGTINPKTGLPEFWGLGGGASSGGHGDTGDGTGGAASGSNGRGNENSATGLTSGTTESRDTSYGGSWGGLSGGQGTNDLAGGLGTDVFGDTALGRIVDGIIQGGSYGSTFGPQGAVLGGAAGLGIQGATEIGRSLGMFGGGSPTNDHDNGRDADAAGGGVHAGTSGGPFGGASSDPGSRGGGSIGGMGGGRGDSGSLPGNHAAIAQNAQQANAGGGLLAALNPAGQPTTPGLPAGLLQYLAQNPGLLQGLVANTRFGTGTVAPISYGQPLA
jgi:hypothetical protein